MRCYTRVCSLVLGVTFWGAEACPACGAVQVDIEDLGGQGPRRRGKGGQGQTGASSTANGTANGGGPPEMLNPLIRGSLTKQVRHWREQLRWAGLGGIRVPQTMAQKVHMC